MNTHTESYFVQWSEREHQFHIEQTTSSLEATLKDFLSGGTAEGYVTLAIVDCYEEADKWAHALAKKRDLLWNEEEMRWVDPKV